MRNTATHSGVRMEVPFFRPKISEEEIAEVVDSLRSGWLTTGPKVRQFEQEFARQLERHVALLRILVPRPFTWRWKHLDCDQGKGCWFPR